MKNLKKESGQSLVIFAVLFIVMVGFAGIVIDYGYPSMIGMKMQNAADSAVLAAARQLPVDSTGVDNIKDIAYQYVEKNGFDRSEAVVDVLSDGTGKYNTVKVTITRYVNFTIGKIFNNDGSDISRSATAKLAALTGLKDTVPLSIRKDEMDACIAKGTMEMTLKYGGGGGTQGAYGCIDPDGGGGGASDYRERLREGYHDILSTGDLVDTENGNMSGPTSQGIEDRYEMCTHFPGEGGCTPEHYDVNCPRVMLVPVVEYVSAHQCKIVGFAPFLIASYPVGSGNECYVHGTYLPDVIMDGEVEEGKEGNPYGTYKIVLTD